MIQLDVRSLYVFSACLMTVTGLVLGLMWKRDRGPHLGSWASGFVLYAVGDLCISLRGMAPDWLSIVLANTGILAGAMQLYAGSCRFIGVPVPARMLAWLLGVYVLAYIGLTHIRPDTNARILVYSSANAVVAAFHAHVLLHNMARSHRLSGVPAALFSLVAIAMLLQFLSVLHTPGPSDFMASPTSMVALELLWIVSVAGSAIGFIAMHANVLLTELQLQASTDEMTGLINRRALTQRLHEHIELARRGGGALAVLMVDIDLFKRINDTYGHAVGDQAIARLGAVLRGSLRPYDCGARFGGEEFVLLLPRAGAQDALAVAERIRQSDLSFVPGDSSSQPQPFTVSIGVTCWDARDTSDGDVLARADAAMYSAKHQGRNCVVDNFPAA